jgi:hypothetical protein
LPINHLLCENRQTAGRIGQDGFRAKDDLHLMVPQRFFTHGQNAQGDHHVYASRTRFIPDELLGLFKRTTWPSIPTDFTARDPSQGVRIDVAARMRGMWR